MQAIDQEWHRLPSGSDFMRTVIHLAFVLAMLSGTRFASAQDFAVLYSFSGGGDAQLPLGSVLAVNGDLYGTTMWGGENFGTVFKLDKNGNETILHVFTGGADGQQPYAGLIVGMGGYGYGTTPWGGAHGGGTVYAMKRNGGKAILHSFNGATGANPMCLLVQDAAGNLYGTAGTVFKLNGHKLTVLHTFSGGDGLSPVAGLLLNSGYLYGTTVKGGTGGGGTIFKLKLDGSNFTTLYNFTGGADGGHPYSTLIRDAAGNLYGTTSQGGDLSCSVNSSVGCGAVFKIDARGEETVLYRFTGLDGAIPMAGLVADGKGGFYGTTQSGGDLNFGTIFEITADGQESVAHSFNFDDGAFPYAGLTKDTEGSFYGTTEYGGRGGCPGSGCGTVFRLTP